MGRKKEGTKSTWKLMANDFTDNDIIDEDELIAEPEVTEGASGAACGDEVEVLTSDNKIVKKKRACKDCTCGLAEELEEKEEAEIAKNTSGCGNCAKGDAFRCAACPYLGAPTFTPGTKPQIVTKSDGSKVLLNDDFTQSDIFA